MRSDGALLCARYAFAPNLYHYCGPETRGEFGEYVTQEMGDGKLVEHLTKFETVYPYLQAIAQANFLHDPLDRRVVEAYWVGNDLLENISEKAIHEALMVGQQLPKRLPKKELKWLLPKIDRQARLHHSFHVFNVFTMTGHRMKAEAVETMDSCRISWGKIAQSSKLKAQNHTLKLDSQKLICHNGTLRVVPTMRAVVVAQEGLGKRLKVGDWVSVHWGIVCDRLSERQVKRLEKYTRHHLQLANETI